MVGAVAPLRFSQRSLAVEARVLECALLGDVLHVGRGLDPVRGGVAEEQDGQLRLGPCSETGAAVAGEQPDADHRASGAGVRSPLLPAPAHVAGDFSGGGRDGQGSVSVEGSWSGNGLRGAGTKVIEGAVTAEEYRQISQMLRAQEGHSDSQPC